MTGHKAPAVAWNQNGSTVADSLNRWLAANLERHHDRVEVAVATGFFEPGGFELLADQLERAEHVRILIGAEPEPGGRRVRSPDSPDPVNERLARLDMDYEQDRNLLGFDRESDRRACRLVTWLRSGRVEVRRYEHGFMHGKAFLVRRVGDRDWEGFVAGSSNMTGAGLTRNVELNVGRDDAIPVGQVAGWFEHLWEESVPYDLASVYQARWEPYRPYDIYIRMLHEAYASELETLDDPTRRTDVTLARFQQDAVASALTKLQQWNGCVIADEVGLGKTFIAWSVAQVYAVTRRQRVLVVCPATLRDTTWAQIADRHPLPGVDIVSYEQVGNIPEQDQDRYSLVIIDEAHAYRNPGTARYENLVNLLTGQTPKHVLALTATPVNNGIADLYNLLNLFVKNDACLTSRGVPSIAQAFTAAAAVDPDDLDPDILLPVIDAFVVRRTRRFVRDNYPDDTILRPDGTTQKIRFPEPELREATYQIDRVVPDLFTAVHEALTPGEDEHSGHGTLPAGRLTLARYTPSLWATEQDQQRRARELSLAGLIRSGLLKRFESSAGAFTATVNRMIRAHRTFLGLLDQNLVPTPDAWSLLPSATSDDLDGIVDDPGLVGRMSELCDPGDRYDLAGLRSAVEHDLGILEQLVTAASVITPDNDPKLDRLVALLAGTHQETSHLTGPNARDEKKTVVFTYFADTAEWISRRLRTETGPGGQLAGWGDRWVVVTGKNDRGTAAEGFSPRTMSSGSTPGEDRYDLLVATDVLAEGVNLQQARRLVNYDLPWNPQRLAQRYGRIDRIGTEHDTILITVFLPDQHLDALLNLEHRLHTKISAAARTIGITNQLLPGSETRHAVFGAEQLLDLTRTSIHGELLAVSGEELRQRLRIALAQHTTRERIEKLPWGAGSGLEWAQNMIVYVFCARVAGWTEPVYRTVPYDPASGRFGDPDNGPLNALRAAACTPDTPRHLPGPVTANVYQAWEHATTDIIDEWETWSDPAAYTPTVPGYARRAARLLRDHHDTLRVNGYSDDTIDQAVIAMETVHDRVTSTTIRSVLTNEEPPARKAVALIELARVRGLLGRRTAIPEPRPPITEDDIHLICWMAVSPPTCPG